MHALRGKVAMYFEAKLDEHGLMSATNDILIKPFARERSPWEILIFHGADSKACRSKKQSLVVFRYHHALSDGYSITKLMANVTTGDYFISPLVEQDHAGWKRFLEFLLFPFTGMFVIVAYLQHYIDNNIWSYKVNFRAKKIRDMTYFCSDTISIDKIKQLKNKLGCSFNGIVLAAIAGGIRRHFVTHENHVPPHMHVGLSFPVPGHPAQTLTNHWTAAFIRLPIGLSSSLKRLDEIQKQFKKVETMIISKMPFTGALYGGAFFKDWISFILRNLLKGSTCSMSIFPGPENLQFLTGEKITSGGFLLGPLANQGVSITVVSYNGGLRVFFGAEKSVVCPEDAKQVVSFISNEFDNFLSLKIA
ncbi:unnamed protein product [Allacma fusca]|uniref:O-acyltransferase WSD1 C-terminal domain-containing protein n=1 Tax=Allacma fusca TaxID=39272 RepID=A0A8J2JVC8_9HEXA|nr:unnamed protein product [Allacma fusca]